MKYFSHHPTVLLLLLFQHSNLTFADGISSMTPSMSPSMMTIDDGASSSPTLADDLSETSNSPTVDGDNVGDESQIPSQSPSSAGDDSSVSSESPSAAPTVNDNMLVPTLSLAPTMPFGSTNAPSLSPQPSVADNTVDGIPTISLQPSGSMQPQMNTQFPHHTMAPHHTFPPHRSRAPTGSKPSSNANPNNWQGQGEDDYESLKVPAFILGGVVILSAAFCVAQRVKRYRQFQGVRETADMNWDLELSTYQPGLT
jgi:hypothetical protein